MAVLAWGNTPDALLRKELTGCGYKSLESDPSTDLVLGIKELPGNYPVFVVVMIIYHYIERIWRILVTPNFSYSIYNNETILSR